MSLRTKIVLLNGAVLALALLASAIAVGGLWAALAPFHRAVEAETRAVAVAAQLGLSPAQTHVIEDALAAAQRAERAIADTALIATAVPVGLLAAGGLVCATLSLSFSRHLLRRLNALADATGAVARGDRTVRLGTPDSDGTSRRADELDELLGAFNRMVAQLAAAEGRARAAEQMRTRFFAGVSHDLRTPLTTIAGLLESLQREDWDHHSRSEFVDLAHREAMRLSHLVTDLLDLTRIEAGSGMSEPEPVDLSALAATLVADLSLPAGPLAAREVQLNLRPGAVAWGDEIQLRRVVENLLTNASKFSPPPTPITLEVVPDATENGVRVSVTDHGPGIPDADVPHVFDRFYRGAAAQCGHTQRAPAGTGLGLAIARGIVEAHRGRIWIEHPPTAGARVVFTVPAPG